MTKQLISFGQLKNKRYKGILIDVDLTLTNSLHIISVKTQDVIRKVSKKIPVGLCTGRSFAMLRNYILKFFPNASLHVLSGGGEVSTSTGKAIWQQNIKSNLVKHIAIEVEKMRGEFCFSKGNTLYGSKHILNNYSKHPWNIKTDFPHNLGSWDTPLISIVDINKDVKSFILSLSSINVKEMMGPDGLPYFDITKKGINKSLGAKKWTKILNIDLTDVIAFGDNLNDIELLQKVGTGIAMGNANDEVKKAVKFIIGDTDNDSLALCLEQLFL